MQGRRGPHSHSRDVDAEGIAGRECRCPRPGELELCKTKAGIAAAITYTYCAVACSKLVETQQSAHQDMVMRD